jgi:hypothetical protein
MSQLYNEWPHVSVVVGGKQATQDDVEQMATIGAQLGSPSTAWIYFVVNPYEYRL